VPTIAATARARSSRGFQRTSGASRSDVSRRKYEPGDHAAIEKSDGTVLKEILIAGVHPELAPFLDSIWSQLPTLSPAGEAVGIVESMTLAGAILAADRALKAAQVSLCRMRLGQGIGGKAFFVLTGQQGEVEAALEAAKATLSGLESFVRNDLIARPDLEALSYF